ncbi:hypothetical protein [Leucobacter sp.]
MIRKILGTAATVVVVAAALGLACWFVSSAATGATLVTFRTGSMSPAMPQGAVAVTLPTPADALRIGDVVTVQRAGEPMPVTHRVIEIREVTPPGEHAPDLRAAAPGGEAPDPRDPDAREIVMQGDDNDTPDHLPYVVTEVRRAVFAVPHAGTALMLLQTPIGAGTLVLGVGALVTWAFWPRRDDEDPGPQRERDPERAPRHASEVSR